MYLPADQIRARNQQLDELLKQANRQPENVRRSLMTGCVFGKTKSEVRQKVTQRTNGKRTPKELAKLGLAVGTGSQIVDQLGAIAEAGMQRVMLQWLDLDDLDGLEALAASVLPQVQ